MDDGGSLKTSFLFPGQGSQFVGMGRELAQQSGVAKKVFEEADEILNAPLSRICFEGPEDELRQTQNTQPAIFTHSIALLRVMDARPGEAFQAAAGHSLGEYSAYVAAGSLTFEDGLRLVRRRGELMLTAGLDRPGTMAAVLGLDPHTLMGILAETPGVVVPANLNSPGQVVISGEVSAVTAAMEKCKQAGAKRVIPLDVSGAFHSPLMEGAAQGLAEALRSVVISPSRVPVYANASAAPVTDPERIRESLAAQLLSPVRWEDTIRAMMADGFGRFVEVGPGRVLSGLARSIDRGAVTESIAGPDEITSFVQGGTR
jgi:[acyl-carrier-protein] S-malonyltransferase